MLQSHVTYLKPMMMKQPAATPNVTLLFVMKRHLIFGSLQFVYEIKANIEHHALVFQSHARKFHSEVFGSRVFVGCAYFTR